MKNDSKKKIKMDDLNNNIEELAMSVAKGFRHIDDTLGKDVSELKTDVSELKTKVEQIDQVLKATRQDVLNIGDRFVPRFEFDNLLIRVSRIEKKLVK